MVDQTTNPLDTSESIAEGADLLAQIENAEQLVELKKVPEFTRPRLNRAARRLPPSQQQKIRQWATEIMLLNQKHPPRSFPTLTSGDRSTSRPAGQTKCEKWFKDKGLVKSGYQLSAQAIAFGSARSAIALIMGFPPNWFDCLSPTERQEELKADISQEEQSPQDKQPSPSAESSTSTQLLGGNEKLLEHKRKERSSLSQRISIPCIVKQPKQPEVKGVIRKDEGDRFVVEVDGETIFVSKLFV